MNGMQVECYKKRQATVEMATCSSELVSTTIAVDQIMDLRTSLRYLGDPVKRATYMFGDNKSVIQSSTLLHLLLIKGHNA